MAHGGKVLAWHATNASKNNAKYTLRLAGEDGKWTTDRSVSTIKDALAYTEWDVVSLQPYGVETTTGIAGNNEGDYAFDDTHFGKLKQSIPYFLDLTETYVPHAKVYYYMHLSEHNTTNYADALANTNSTYVARASVAQTVMTYHGTVNTSKRLAGVVPVGTAIQNARTTYLTTLSNATSSSEVTLQNDPVFGLQRDGGHLSFNVGRYIAALTFAEKIIPASFRNGQIDCGMRASESVGKLPAQYEEIARKAVTAAINAPNQLTTISGYETDPIGAIKTAAESTYEESAWASEAAFKAAVEAKIADFAGAKVESVAFSDGTATVTLRYGYSEATATICHKYTSYPYVPGAPTYPATAPAAPNGTVTVTPANASKGTNVTVTVKPNEGYELGSLAVKDASGNLLPLADLGNGKFGFVMPASKVSVEANFVKSAVSTGFADVPANAFFADAVKWAVDKGVTNGLTDTMFGPYEPCTRGQIITFLWRAAGSPEPKTAVSFADVPAGSYYAKAVAWAIENGITNGMTETTFAPDATCTRGQGVTFLYRALKGSAGATSSFVDVPTNAFYADAVGWAVSGKVTDGTSNTTFSPDDNCTRGQIVTFLFRAYSK